MAITDDGRVHGRITAAALCWSAVAAGLGLWWVLWPSAYLLGRGDAESPPLAFDIAARPGAIGLLALGGLGVVVALTLRGRRRVETLRRPLLAVTAGYAVLGFVLPGYVAMVVVAYAFAFSLPVVLLAALLARALRLGRAGTSVLVGVPVAAGIGFAAYIVAYKGAYWAVFTVVGGVIWAACTVTAFRTGKRRCAGCGRPGAAWTRPESAARWGRTVTIAAALMPLPYGLARLTWLTPWRIAFPEDAGWGIWITGMLLGCASEGGAILTRGLIRPWGEVWPRWVPVVHGRPIPVAVPTSAALTASAVLTLFTVYVVTEIPQGEGGWLFSLAFIPIGLWGPLLAAAALAYYYRRRGACTHCPQEPATPIGRGASAEVAL
ncbi:hypothetical protein [Actinomadura sp. B10D3]|uniref:hypothetical protein n=1 Tax=Actinomadura sp. B10D3 TaxID=3153557 RepID=UPI00325E1399